jgi:alkyldihydroxyacetonephosphate synthase
MDQILEINDQNLTVTCQVGINGANIERDLNEKGYTMGHIPQSVRTSTIAGYIAMKAAGQFSGKYGKFEDIVLSLRAVLPTGEVIQSKNYPRSSTGPQFDRLLIGSEGTLGIVTEATMKIWSLPEKQGLVSYTFAKIQDALEAIRLIYRHQVNPAVIRIYDHVETARHFSAEKKAGGRAMVIFVCEGPTDVVDLEVQVTNQYCTQCNGIACGEEPVHHWFETRFDVKESSKYTPLDVVFDTVEMAAMWDHAYDMYESVIGEMRKVPGCLVASGHASHFYTQGVCWYFTFGGAPEIQDQFPEFHQAMWDAAMRGCLQAQGTISHHHGIGIIRSKWMEKEWTGPDMEMARRIKKVLDPNNIMNPGKLYGADFDYSPENAP